MDELQLAPKSQRIGVFKEWWLPELLEIFEVHERPNGSFTFETKEFGIMDFFPKANKLLVRKNNDWKSPGLEFIKKNILK